MSEVVVTSGTGLATNIKAGQHSWLSDEPVSAGGTDSGPNPYELLLSALGACTVMTLQIYARRKGWPLEGVEVALSHSRVHARDCAECEQRDGWLDRISKRLTLRGPLDDDQRQRLADIAERCPVRLTLSRELVISQTLED